MRSAHRESNQTVSSSSMFNSFSIQLFWHQAILWHHWASYNLTQFWHCLLGDAIRYHRHHATALLLYSRHPLQAVGSQVTHNFCPTWLQIKGSYDSLFSFVSQKPENRWPTIANVLEDVNDRDVRWRDVGGVPSISSVLIGVREHHRSGI
jgi:hypothetical protein